MDKQNKELLLKDLCCRLPYGVKIKFNDGTDDVYNLDGNIHGKFTENVIQAIDDLELKPYLRPMSSMTKEEFSKVKKLFGFEITTSLGKTYIDDWKQGLNEINYTIDLIDWLNAHHFDFRGLIKKGLAVEAPDGIYRKSNNNK